MEKAHLSPSAPTSAGKIRYLDHVKVVLTVLVVLHHVCITYGGPGSWYYAQPTSITTAKLVMTVFVASNQAFFMGLFFFLSAYFVEPSLQRKGAGTFLSDRFKRLGIPTIFYSLILATLVNFLVYRYGYHKPATLAQYLAGYDDWINPGVMWFALALLLFSIIYVALRQLGPLQWRLNLPGYAGVLLFATALGIITFLNRLFFPVGWVLEPLGFQLCHFPQYIAFFTLGIVARQNDWLGKLSYPEMKGYLWLAAGLVFIVLPALLIYVVVSKSTLADFSGGWAWQSLAASLWEQLTGVTLSLGLLAYAKQHWNNSGLWLEKASRCAFAVYMFHPLVAVGFSVLLTDWPVEPVIKLLIVAPLSVIATFLLGSLLVRVPGLKNYL